MISFKSLLGVCLLVLGLASSSNAKTCTATYASWTDWTICSGCPLGEGDSENWKIRSGYPHLLGSSLSHDFDVVDSGYRIYVGYSSPSVSISFNGKDLYFLIWTTYLDYPKGSIPPSSLSFQYYSDFALVHSTCPEDNPDDDDDDDDEDDDDDCCGLACLGTDGLNSLLNFCSNYPNECSYLIPHLPSCDEEECPDLNLTIRGTLLPARRGRARITGDWCKSLDCDSTYKFLKIN